MADEYTREEVKNMSMKEYRKNIPSGWMEVTRYDSLVLMIDALLSSPPNREFKTNELADKSGITPKSVESHIGSLVGLGVVEKMTKNRDRPRYTINEKSPITQEIFKLNRIVEQVKSNEMPKSLPDKQEISRSNTSVSTAEPNEHNSQVQPGHNSLKKMANA